MSATGNEKPGFSALSGTTTVYRAAPPSERSIGRPLASAEALQKNAGTQSETASKLSFIMADL